MPDGSLVTQVVVHIGEKTLGPIPLEDGTADDYIFGTFGTENVSLEYQDNNGNILYHGLESVLIKKKGVTDALIKLCPEKSHRITPSFTITPKSREIKMGEEVKVDASGSLSTHFSQDSLWIKWDWGDETPPTSLSQRKTEGHHYNTPGEKTIQKTITLTVKDNLDKVPYDRDICGNIPNMEEVSIVINVLPRPPQLECIDFSLKKLQPDLESVCVEAVEFSFENFSAAIVVHQGVKKLELAGGKLEFAASTAKITLPKLSNQVKIMGTNVNLQAKFRTVDSGGNVSTPKLVDNTEDFEIVLRGVDICCVEITGQRLYIEEICYQF